MDGYLSAIGHNHANFIVQSTKDLPLQTVPNQRSMVFQVHPKLTYNVSNGYNKILLAKHKLQQLPDQDAAIIESIRMLQLELKVQEPRKLVEIQNNQNMIINSRGDPIMYGMSI